MDPYFQEETPGPGAYNVEKSSRSASPFPTSPAYTIAGRFNAEHAATEQPGPGTYNTRSGESSPAYTLGGRQNQHHARDGPGPGAYTPHERPTSPAYTVTGRQHGSGRPEPSPGPGSYNTRSRPDGPSYTMAGRVLGQRQREYRGLALTAFQHKRHRLLQLRVDILPVIPSRARDPVLTVL